MYRIAFFRETICNLIHSLWSYKFPIELSPIESIIMNLANHLARRLCRLAFRRRMLRCGCRCSRVGSSICSRRWLVEWFLPEVSMWSVPIPSSAVSSIVRLQMKWSSIDFWLVRQRSEPNTRNWRPICAVALEYAVAKRSLKTHSLCQRSVVFSFGFPSHHIGGC